MFTGLIKEVGIITAKMTNPEGAQFEVECQSAQQLKIGDSLAISGVCHTVTKVHQNKLTFQSVHTTLEKTNFSQLTLGTRVNLEPALTLQDPLGGHLVQGHVNGVGRLIEKTSQGENWDLWVELPSSLLPYIILEGSLALEGISLTIAEVVESKIRVTIIPHTWEVTNLSSKEVGDQLNVEVDAMAKMVEKLVKTYLQKEKQNAQL